MQIQSGRTVPLRVFLHAYHSHLYKLMQPLTVSTQAEFLGEIETKVLGVFLLAIYSHLH